MSRLYVVTLLICWEGLGAGGEGDDRGWDGWMASLTRCTWVWVNSGSWWWTGRPGVLWFMESQRVGHDWATDLIWSDAEYFVWNAGLDEAQAGIKIAGRNQEPQRCRWHHPYAESEEKLKSFLVKVKEKSEKAGLKVNIQKTKIMASSPITSWQIDGETMETVTDYFLGLKNHCRWWLQPWN